MVLDLFLIGLAITLYPLPGMAFVLVVSAPRGVYKGLAFILAWLACLVAVIAMVLLFTDGKPPAPRSPPGIVALVAMLVIGLGLIVYGEHRRRRRHRGDPPPSSDEGGGAPTSRMNRATVWSAAGLAVLLQPWGMVSAAAATVVKADLSHSASFLALFGFCLLATASLLAMELYMVFAPEKAQRDLLNLRAWMHRHKDQAIVLICLLLGLWLVGRSLYELT
ncbi:GAP family protein [Streptomyces gardneri]|uniref:GAP family protein n=1 Tax=Streptomyces gardneri TaxID=66892 RepID=A0A4Y3RSY8_9ACTN|nr:GAP family protein [Streptomyces gardneri]ALO08135.1 hypothetical protein AQF52_2540 [Streptomyces venezuelae]QPK45400.1 GAP family protein [Streptomyces gardneri]WRK36724.1 GAP family protein [Streptomyces venezuelae]CUM41514.1 hypothetical protein BN2537_11993 [Streptomyces venezuelae]GEB59010.1 hypothetical protein SGA01_46150 [Streptomyces gardneri]